MSIQNDNTIILQISSAQNKKPVSLHLIPNIFIPEEQLQSLLSIVLDIPYQMTIVGLAVRISSVVPSAINSSHSQQNNNAEAIVVPLSSLSANPEYFGDNAQRANWLALYESDDHDGYFYLDNVGNRLSAGNTNDNSTSTSSTTEGRGRPMSAASSDRSSGGQRHRPVRTEGRGRPLSAVPSDKNHGGRRLRPNRDRPFTASPEGSSYRNKNKNKKNQSNTNTDASTLRPATAPVGNRRAPSTDVMSYPAGAEEDFDDFDVSSASGSVASSMRSMAVQLSGSQDSQDSQDSEDSEDSEDSDDSDDSEDSEDREYSEMSASSSGESSSSSYGDEEEFRFQSPRNSSSNNNSVPFFDTQGSIGVSSWENNSVRNPRVVGLGPL